MMNNLKIEGIYDLRTLKFLKSKGLSDFGFNFSPRSFNFIQEYVFLEQLIPLLDQKDSIHLHFGRDDDPMIQKVLDDLSLARIAREQIFLCCEERSDFSFKHDVKHFLNYLPSLSGEVLANPRCAGIVFDFYFLENLHERGVLNNFIANFYTHFKKNRGHEIKCILKVDWHSNIMPSLFDYFDFDLVSFSIDSKIEICYRNVDLNKLTEEMTLFEKSRSSLETF